MKKEIPSSIYFGGCAFGVAYYIGVYKAMIEEWGADFPTKMLVCGDSAGIIMVLGIAQQFTPEYIGELYCKTGENAVNGLLFDDAMGSLETHCLSKLMKDFTEPLLYKTLEGKILIGGSSFFANHFWKSKWKNNTELFYSARNSFYIPCLCKSKISSYTTYTNIDGAFIFSGENLPDGDKTLYIADDENAEISMNMSLTEMFFPQLNDKYDNKYNYKYDEMVQKGYNSFVNWNGEYKKKVGFRKPKYAMQILLWLLYGMNFIVVFLHVFLPVILSFFYYAIYYLLIYSLFVYPSLVVH